MWGKVVGSLATLVVSAVLTVILIYFLTATGKDYWWLKGMGIEGAAWVGLWGILIAPGISTVVPINVVSNLAAFVLYLLWGLLAAYLVLRWGDDRLFTGVDKLS